MLKYFKYHEAPDRRAGKINGAEILSDIRSLPDSQQQTNELRLYDYKRRDLPFTELLKLIYNRMLKSKCVVKSFFKSLPAPDNMHSFRVDY